MNAHNELLGKVAVITGAASGIGLALALHAADAGMKVALADIEQSALDVAVDRLSAKGAVAIGAQVDVSDAPAVNTLAAAVESELGPPWLVCNNAGVCKFGLSWKLTVADRKWMLDVDLGGVVNGLNANLPAMVGRDGGYIVNTASAAGLLGVPGPAPYVAAKHAIIGLSEALYRELQAVGSNVGVTVLCPAFVATNIMTSARNQPGVGRGTEPPAFDPAAFDEPLDVLQADEVAA